MARPRVNLADIAERLGVSISTVSRALRGHPAISEDSRARITAVAAELGYVPPSDRRPVRDARPQVLVLSLTDAPMHDMSLLSGISAGSIDLDVTVLVHHVTRDQCERLLDPRHQPVALREGTVDGIILLHRWPDDVAARLAALRPVVSLVHEYVGLPIDHVGLHDRSGMAALVRHFVEGGHRAIGFFGYHPDISWARARFGAYVEAMMASGLEVTPRDCVPVTLDEALSSGIFADAAWTAAVERRRAAGVRAWIAASSATGETLVSHFRRRGLAFPADVEVADCHGRPSPDPASIPAITTTDVLGEELGAATLRRLVTRIQHPHESHRSILLPMRLVQGETTRPPARRA